MGGFPDEARRRKDSEVVEGLYHEGDKVSILELIITDRKHQAMEHTNDMITPALRDALQIFSHVPSS